MRSRLGVYARKHFLPLLHCLHISPDSPAPPPQEGREHSKDEDVELSSRATWVMENPEEAGGSHGHSFAIWELLISTPADVIRPVHPPPNLAREGGRAGSETLPRNRFGLTLHERSGFSCPERRLAAAPTQLFSNYQEGRDVARILDRAAMGCGLATGSRREARRTPAPLLQRSPVLRI